jgi:hypothetical protein
MVFPEAAVEEAETEVDELAAMSTAHSCERRAKS